MDNKLKDLITNFDNKLIDSITDRRNKESTKLLSYREHEKKKKEIAQMTCKLQIGITFAMVVRLRPTICQNIQNSEENPKLNPKMNFFCQKNASNCLKFAFKDQNTHSFFFNFLQLFCFIYI